MGMMANALSPMMQKPGLMAGGLSTPEYLSPTAPAPAPAAPRAMPNALSAPSAYMGAPKKPQNEMLGAAVRGFQRGFDPAGFEQQRAQGKADGLEKQKQTLALMQQQRQLPVEQRTQWWQQNAGTIGQIIGQDISQQQVDPAQFTDQALDGQIAALSGQLGIAPATPEPMSAYEAAQIRLKEQEAAQPAKPITVNNRLVDPTNYSVLGDYSDPAKPVQSDYVETKLADGVYFVNKNDPKDKFRIGAAPPKGTGSGANARNPNGLTPYQEIQFQYKLDDLDRELADKERSRRTNLSTVDGSIALLDSFTGDLSKTPEGAENFREVYGNWVNPTGEGTDMLNPRVQPGSKRANGMAMLEQLGGRAFLDSIAAMRGTGPLSDREGARVTAAATRLTAVTQSDEAALEAAKEFRAALVAYKSALEQDIETNRRAEASRRAQMQAMLGRNPAGQQAPDGEDDDMDGLIDGLFGDQGQEDDDVSDLLDKYK